MLESGKSTTTEELQSAIDQALRSGVDAEAIAHMVAERVKAHRVSDANDIVGVLDAPETPPEDAGDIIYEPGELPDGLIDLPSAAARYSDKYGVSEDAMRQWVNRGRVAKAGRVRAPARGGGYIVVCESELVEFMAQPRNKGGRPRKKTK